MEEIIKLVADNGGSIAIDALPREMAKSARAAEKAGFLKWESGSWADSDYYLLTEQGRAIAVTAQRSPTHSR